MIDQEKFDNLIERETKLSDYQMEEFRDVKECVIQVVSYDGAALKHTTDELRDDREVVLEAVKYNSFAILQANERFLEDLELCKIALEKHDTVFPYLGDIVKDNEEIVSEVLPEHPKFYKHVSDRLRDNEEYTQIALQNDRTGDLLQYLPDRYRNNYKFVMEYVKDFPNSIFQAGDEILNRVGSVRHGDANKVIQALILHDELTPKKPEPKKAKVFKV